MEQQEIIYTLKGIYSKLDTYNKGNAKIVNIWKAMGDIEDLIEKLEE